MNEANRGSVMVTGCSSGIGKATALHLDRLGFRVFAGVRREEDGESLRRAASPALTPVFMDISDGASITAAAETVARAVGEEGLAGIVNNAGAGFFGPLEFVPWEDFVQQVAVNLLGPIEVTRAFLSLVRRRRGRVINVGSIGGVQPTPFVSGYDACKAGIHALSESLRMELAPQGIHVVLIIPGQIATAVWGKVLAQKEVAAARLSPQAKDLYGGMIADIGVTLQKMSQGGLPPEAVAKVIAEALAAARPKPRYVVGADARVQTLFSKFLPDRIRDVLVLKALGIGRR